VAYAPLGKRIAFGSDDFVIFTKCRPECNGFPSDFLGITVFLKGDKNFNFNLCPIIYAVNFFDRRFSPQKPHCVVTDGDVSSKELV
jgi:hypothetical protein